MRWGNTHLTSATIEPMGRSDHFDVGTSDASRVFPVIRQGELSTSDARRSRAVSHEEFQQIASAGSAQYEKMKQNPSGTKGLDRNWDTVVDHAYNESRNEWGGTTVSTNTGKPLSDKSNRYALTAREPGTNSVSVPPNASREEFGQAMQTARTNFGEVLSRKNHHLGVFHDADRGSIDIDPVTVVPRRKDVEELGAYTRATGGAYHPKSGNGYWPPHVKGS